MNFFPQPRLALPESPKLRVKQAHAKSAAPTTFSSKQPSHPASGRVPQPRDSHIKTLRSSARFTETERSRVTPPRGEFRISHFEF